MAKLKIDIEKCKGCFLCVEACPVKALSPSGEYGANGYEHVKFEEDKCIQCGSCYRMCPDSVIEILE